MIKHKYFHDGAGIRIIKMVFFIALQGNHIQQIKVFVSCHVVT